MPAYIIVEPDLTIETVPAHLADWEQIQWPDHRNTLPELAPGDPVPMINPKGFYERTFLRGTTIPVFVSVIRDPNALPAGIAAEILAREAGRSPLHQA